MDAAAQERGGALRVQVTGVRLDLPLGDQLRGSLGCPLGHDLDQLGRQRNARPAVRLIPGPEWARRAGRSRRPFSGHGRAPFHLHV